MQTLIAQRSLYYGTPPKRMKAGDSFDAEDKHARLLILARAARPAEEAAEEVEPSVDTAETSKPKRRYKRRDLQPED